MNGRVAVAAGIFLAVSACAVNPPANAVASNASEPAIPVRGDTGAGRCDPTNIQQFVGQEVTADLQAQMKSVSGAGTIRIVPPGTAITMEFSAERLTVYTDAANRVERISCS